MLVISREAGHSGSYLLGELLAARGVAVLFEWAPSTCNPPISIETVLASAMEHCHTCRDRDGAELRQVRLLPRQLGCANASCVPSPLRSCVGAALINGLSIALTAPRSIPRVHLTRTNVVKHALSQLTLWENHHTEANVSARAPKRVPPAQLIEMIERMERARKLQSSYLRGIDHFLTYEGLQLNPNAELDVLFRVMRLPTPQLPAQLERRVQKTTSDNLRSVVTNFDEVGEALLRLPRGRCYLEMWTSDTPREFEPCSSR